MCLTLIVLCALVFSVDYSDELDILVSGSADFAVKVWALSAGTCLNTLTGHTEWVTKVGRPRSISAARLLTGGEWRMVNLYILLINYYRIDSFTEHGGIQQWPESKSHFYLGVVVHVCNPDT